MHDHGRLFVSPKVGSVFFFLQMVTMPTILADSFASPKASKRLYLAVLHAVNAVTGNVRMLALTVNPLAPELSLKF